MQQNSTSAKSGLPYPVILIIGIVLMLAGYYVSKNPGAVGLASFKEAMDARGLPLDLGKTVSVIGVFLILFPVIRAFYIGPLDEAISSRNSELEQTFTEAENLRTEMTQMKRDYEGRLVATEAAAREQIQKEIADARRFADEKVAKVTAEIDEMKAKATEEIERQKQSALTELRLMVTNLTLAATEKVLGENVDTAKNRQLIDQFIDEVEVKA